MFHVDVITYPCPNSNAGQGASYIEGVPYIRDLTVNVFVTIPILDYKTKSFCYLELVIRKFDV